MTHENQREKEKQMENDRRDYACDPIVTEPGNEADTVSVVFTFPAILSSVFPAFTSI